MFNKSRDFFLAPGTNMTLVVLSWNA